MLLTISPKLTLYPSAMMQTQIPAPKDYTVSINPGEFPVAINYNLVTDWLRNKGLTCTVSRCIGFYGAFTQFIVDDERGKLHLSVYDTTPQSHHPIEIYWTETTEGLIQHIKGGNPLPGVNQVVWVLAGALGLSPDYDTEEEPEQE